MFIKKYLAIFAPNQVVNFPEYAPPGPIGASATVTAKFSGMLVFLYQNS